MTEVTRQASREARPMQRQKKVGDKGQESPTDEGIGGIGPLRPFLHGGGTPVPRKASPRELIPLHDFTNTTQSTADRMDRLDRLDSLQKIHAHSSAETSGLGDSLQRIHTLSSTETSGYGDTVPSPTGFDPSPVDPLHGIPGGHPRPSRSMLHINHPGGNGGHSPGGSKPHMVAVRMKSASLDDDRYSPTKTHHMYPRQPPYGYGNNPQMGTKRYPGNHYHNPGLVRGGDLPPDDRDSPPGGSSTPRRRGPSRQVSTDEGVERPARRSSSQMSLERELEEEVGRAGGSRGGPGGAGNPHRHHHGGHGHNPHHTQPRSHSRASLQGEEGAVERDRGASRPPRRRTLSRQSLQEEPYLERPTNRRRPPSRQHSEDDGRGHHRYAVSTTGSPPSSTWAARQHGGGGDDMDPMRRHHQSDGNLAVGEGSEHRYYADPYHPRPRHLRHHDHRRHDDDQHGEPYDGSGRRGDGGNSRRGSSTGVAGEELQPISRRRSGTAGGGGFPRRWDAPEADPGRRPGVMDQHGSVTTTTATSPTTTPRTTTTTTDGQSGAGGDSGAICMSGGNALVESAAPTYHHHHQHTLEEGAWSRQRPRSSTVGGLPCGSLPPHPAGTRSSSRGGAPGGGGGGGGTGGVSTTTNAAASATYASVTTATSGRRHTAHHSPPPAVPSTSHGLTSGRRNSPAASGADVVGDYYYTDDDEEVDVDVPLSRQGRKGSETSRSIGHRHQQRQQQQQQQQAKGRSHMTRNHKKTASALDAGLDLSLYSTNGTGSNDDDLPDGVGNNYPEVVIGVGGGGGSRRGSYTPTGTPSLSRSESGHFLGVHTGSTWLKWSQDRRNSFKKRLDVLEQRQKELERTRVSTPVRKARKESVMFVSPELESKHTMEEQDELDIHGLHTARPGEPHQRAPPPTLTVTTDTTAPPVPSIPMSRKKRLNAKEDVKLTVNQWNGLLAFWEHSVFVRCRYAGTLLSLMALLLTMCSIGNNDWFRQTATSYTDVIYSGLWQECSTTANGVYNCTRLNARGFHVGIWDRCYYAYSNVRGLTMVCLDTRTNWQNAVIGLLLFAVAFGFLATILSICGACTTTLPKKIYYYHSAGEIYFICALSTTAALIVYPVAIETEKQMAEHQYGVGYGLGWGASFFFFAAAMCMCLDDLVRTIAKGLCCGKKDQSRQSRV